MVPSLRGGGLERVASGLAIGLQHRGIEVGVFPIGGLGTYEAPLRSAGVPVFDCAETALRIRGWPRRLIGALRGFAPDIIHAHSGTWYPSAVARLALRTPRLVYTEHGRYPPEPRGRALLERVLARQTYAVTVVTPSLGDYLTALLRLATPPTVIPNGIDLGAFQSLAAEQRSALRAEWGAEPDDIVFVTVGRLAPVKDHRSMLEALAQLGSEGGRARLVILGEGPLEGQLRQHALERGVGDRVTWLGFRPDVARCLAAADVWVSASTTEGLPLALLEALASGLPVIATAVGGIPETLGTPPAGMLVPPHDPRALADTMRKVMMNKELRASLGVAALGRASTFSSDRMTDTYVSLYRTAAALISAGA